MTSEKAKDACLASGWASSRVPVCLRLSCLRNLYRMDLKPPACPKDRIEAVMRHVNLDTQPEVVRQFVLALSVSPDGVVLESAGHPVACVVPPPKLPNGAVEPEGEWTREKNQRRCELIDRKYDHGLNPSEEAELALLQDAMARYIDKVAPLPLDEARTLHQELLQKAARAGDANDG
jgi:hypothetical protein